MKFEPNVEKLLELIDAAIDSCDSYLFPTICSFRADAREGLKMEIYNLVAKTSCAISEAMANLESAYSENPIE